MFGQCRRIGDILCGQMDLGVLDCLTVVGGEQGWESGMS